jgi:hypothetical protein
MDLRSTIRKWLDYFFQDRATIRDSLGLERFLCRPDHKKGSAEGMIKKRASHLKKQMGLPLDYQWEPQIVENEEKVVPLKRRAK